MEARRWASEIAPPSDLPLINLSQAAPVAAPPVGLRRAMADAIEVDPGAHIYGPTLGRPELRETLAANWSTDYNGQIAPSQVAITSGCNQAFASTVATLATSGDEIILPLPWYFNHKMWLDMSAIKTVALPTGTDLLPDPEHARALITERTRAIVLVTPNNPAGTEYSRELIRAFLELARRSGIALILDETYRDFGCSAISDPDWPHDLFSDPAWDDTLIHLYSFSKAFRMTGHRLGAIVASRTRLSEVEKFQDTVQICPPQLAQIGALWGLENLKSWLADERLETLRRRDAMIRGFASLDRWSLVSCGAYFAYVAHDFGVPSDQLAKQLLAEAGLLCLPGTMFAPEGDPAAKRHLRFAFANAPEAELAKVFSRLSARS